MSVKNKMKQVTVKEDSLIELEDLYIIQFQIRYF